MVLQTSIMAEEEVLNLATGVGLESDLTPELNKEAGQSQVWADCSDDIQCQ